MYILQTEDMLLHTTKSFYARSYKVLQQMDFTFRTNHKYALKIMQE